MTPPTEPAVRRLIRGGTVITMDEQRRILTGADVLIEGDRIAEVGYNLPDTNAQVVDARGRFVLPGLINAHTHTFQTLFRGLGDGLPFTTWQQEVTYPLYQILTPEDAYLFSLVGCLENLHTGVTTAVNFQAYPNGADAVAWTARAFREVGMGGVLVQSFFGRHAPPGLMTTDLETLRAEISATFAALRDDPLLAVWLGPPLPTQAPADWIAAAYELAANHGAGLHMHISESADLARLNRERLGGLGEIEFLDHLGVVDQRFHAAHCVGITDAEVAIMAHRGAHIMHCPESNMYLGSGVARVEAMRQRGVNVAVGTDGPASNNSQNMFAAMKTASLLQKVVALDPRALAPGVALEMATINGARALGRSDLGVLAPGARADIAVVRAQAPHTVVANRPVSTLVYCSQPADVETVLVAGQIVLADGRSTLVDEELVLREAVARAEYLLQKANRTQLRELHWPWA